MDVYNFPCVAADNARIFSIGFLDYSTKNKKTDGICIVRSIFNKKRKWKRNADCESGVTVDMSVLEQTYCMLILFSIAHRWRVFFHRHTHTSLAESSYPLLPAIFASGNILERTQWLMGNKIQFINATSYLRYPQQCVGFCGPHHMC